VSSGGVRLLIVGRRREQAQSITGRDANATRVGAQPPAGESGHVLFVHSQDIADREIQLFVGVGAVGVQRLRVQQRRRRHHLNNNNNNKQCRD